VGGQFLVSAEFSPWDHHFTPQTIDLISSFLHSSHLVNVQTVLPWDTAIISIPKTAAPVVPPITAHPVTVHMTINPGTTISTMFDPLSIDAHAATLHLDPDSTPEISAHGIDSIMTVTTDTSFPRIMTTSSFAFYSYTAAICHALLTDFRVIRVKW